MQSNSTIDATVVAELVTGERVFKLLLELEFQTAWDTLYSNCPWSTVFQSREFVSSWYTTYKSEYLPILVMSSEGGKLIGLLTMALPLKSFGSSALASAKGRIIGAGQYEAEYQCWLAEVEDDGSFVKAAIKKLRTEFPNCDIHFRFLPPNTPLEWATRDPKWRSQLVLQPYKRPLMDLHAPDVSKLFRKPEYRNKLNRLKRLGDLDFEIVTNLNRFAAILPELTVQYDFRQGAMFNKNQFRENPLKAELLLVMFDQGLLHVSVLKSNGEIVASIVAVQGKGWVHLGGINVHSPLHADYYSPGFVHFIMLGQYLLSEGVDVFDLTPGGDSYKERMATGHDEVYELVIPCSIVHKVKKLIKKQLHNRLLTAGLRPMSVELAIKKMVYLSKRRIKAASKPDFIYAQLLRIRLVFTGTDQKLLEVPYKPEEYSPQSLEVKINSLSDLLGYAPCRLDPTRWEFLSEAMRRLEGGESCYTWSDGGSLLGCAWLAGPRTSVPGEVPEGAAMLQGLYLHAAGVGRQGDFLKAVAARLEGPVYVVADAALQRALTEGTNNKTKGLAHKA
ncbi:GNAT family N-acetyltransferase [Pontibacter litorisediminis]|uniref:GNAT family N-acetyltransferase n=1 Tax=Pontibacter litorisediminis TaxID=1846260 RepID=UPI0023EA9632|nr:GNAT family N-acetyltransferase [Pontibacter litorisediminis]